MGGVAGGVAWTLTFLSSCGTSAQTRARIGKIYKPQTTRILPTDFTPSGESTRVRGCNWLNPTLILLLLGLPYPPNLKISSCQHLKIRVFHMKTWIFGFSWKIGSDSSSSAAPPSPRKLKAAGAHPPTPAGSHLLSRLRPAALRSFEPSASGVGASPLPSGGHAQYCMESLRAQRFQG